jgi:ABC-type phosphonate transport system ATPase subunit
MQQLFGRCVQIWTDLFPREIGRVVAAEVESGAGTTTVTRALADRINEDAAPADRVSGNALRNRVQQAEGVKCSERANNPQPQHDQPVRKEAGAEGVRAKVPGAGWSKNTAEGQGYKVLT